MTEPEAPEVETTEIVKAEPIERSVSLRQEEWKLMQTQAEMLVKSGLLPSGITTKEEVLVLALTGRDYGWSLMQSVRLMYIVDQKANLHAQTMKGLVHKYGLGTFEIEADYEHATVTGKRSDTGETYPTTWDWKRAQEAEITEGFNKYKQEKIVKKNWRCYRKEMFINRAISEVCRFLWPELFANMHTPEEIRGIRDEAEVTEIRGEIAEAFVVGEAEEAPSHGEGWHQVMAKIREAQLPERLHKAVVRAAGAIWSAAWQCADEDDFAAILAGESRETILAVNGVGPKTYEALCKMYGVGAPDAEPESGESDDGAEAAETAKEVPAGEPATPIGDPGAAPSELQFERVPPKDAEDDAYRIVGYVHTEGGTYQITQHKGTGDFGCHCPVWQSGVECEHIALAKKSLEAK